MVWVFYSKSSWSCQWDSHWKEIWRPIFQRMIFSFFDSCSGHMFTRLWQSPANHQKDLNPPITNNDSVCVFVVCCICLYEADLGKALLVDMVHHNYFIVIAGWRAPRAEERQTQAAGVKYAALTGKIKEGRTERNRRWGEADGETERCNSVFFTWMKE